MNGTSNGTANGTANGSANSSANSSAKALNAPDVKTKINLESKVIASQSFNKRNLFTED
jgi:hypothetical protein